MTKSQYSYISGSQMIKYLQKYYQISIVSQKWSHIKVKWADGKVSIIPNHKELAYGTFSDILTQLWIDEKVFLDQINK